MIIRAKSWNRCKRNQKLFKISRQREKSVHHPVLPEKKQKYMLHITDIRDRHQSETALCKSYEALKSIQGFSLCEF